MAKKYMKKCLTFSHKGNANQTTLNGYLTPVRRASIKNTNKKC
jgi:hypothetical protein